MGVLLLGAHVLDRHAYPLIDPLDELHGVRIAQLAVAEDDRAAPESVVLGRLGTAVLGSPHRMRRYEAAPARVLRDHLAQFLLGRAHVDNDLPIDLIEHLDGQQRNRIYRRSQHHQIGPGDSLGQRCRPVDEPQFERLGPVSLGIVDSDHLVANSVILERQSKRSSDQPDAYDGRFHNTIPFIWSAARCSTSSVAQRLMRM